MRLLVLELVVQPQVVSAVPEKLVLLLAVHAYRSVSWTRSTTVRTAARQAVVGGLPVAMSSNVGTLFEVGVLSIPSVDDVVLKFSRRRCLTRLRPAEQPQSVSCEPLKLAVLVPLPVQTICSKSTVELLVVTVVPKPSSVPLERSTHTGDAVSSGLSWLSMVVEPLSLTPPVPFQ